MDCQDYITESVERKKGQHLQREERGAIQHLKNAGLSLIHIYVWGQEGKEKSLPLMVNLLKYGRQHSAVTILEGILDSVQYHGLFQTALEEYCLLYTSSACLLFRLF